MDSAKEAEDKMPDGATVNFVRSPVRKRYLFKQGLDHLKPEEN